MASRSRSKTLIVDGALAAVESRLRGRLQDAATALDPEAAILRQVVGEGNASLRALLVGPGARTLMPPPGAARAPDKHLLSFEALQEISAAVAGRLSSTLSTAYPGQDLLSLARERFAMTAEDVARLIARARDAGPNAPAAFRRGQVSNVSGRVLEGRFLTEHSPEVRTAEASAAAAEIADLVGAGSPAGQTAGQSPAPPPGPLREMFRVLAAAGLSRTHVDGLWIRRVPGARDAAGELTDGLTLVLDLRDPSKIDVVVVGLRESKLASVVDDLRVQVRKDFDRLLGGQVDVDGKQVQVRLSKHLVVSLLTESKTVSATDQAAIRDAFTALTQSTLRPIVEVDGTRDAQLAREIARSALEIGGTTYADALKQK
jgi:hypothetical protein